ncbi:MAG TPA: hypothetical protein VFY29_05055 [Terriglobia bacterium]|nr:hypothetical protein [Terriglobia bacterium]
MAHAAELAVLLRGETRAMELWARYPDARRFLLNAAAIVGGAGVYGAAMGWWRAPEQALFAAIKFPPIVLLTTLGNAVLNAMLAPLLGLNISFRQSLSAVLMSFAVAGIILAAFSPLAAFVVWNAPPMTPETIQTWSYNFIKVTHVAAIAFAGVAGNVRLLQLLVEIGGSRQVARRVLVAWLAVNLFLGSRLSWILRPFIGAPHLPVAFVRENALENWSSRCWAWRSRAA